MTTKTKVTRPGSRPARPGSTRTRPGRPSRPSGARRPGDRAGRGLLIVAAVAVVAALVLAVAVTATSGGDDTDTAADPFDTATASVEPGTPVLPALPETGDDPAVGRAAPRVEGLGRDGEALALPAAGRPSILVFVAHWCPHCQAEVPRLQQWIDEGALPDGVDVAAVATAYDPNRPNHPSSDWLDREGWTPPTVADADGSAAAAYGLTSFPYWVAVGADGTVVARRTGELTLQEVTDMALEARDAAPAI
ncbi:MAG TPA: TlpA disulfide reductase family protein [Acidimicrobiales bacterium]